MAIFNSFLIVHQRVLINDGIMIKLELNQIMYGKPMGISKKVT